MHIFLDIWNDTIDSNARNILSATFAPPLT